MRVVNQSRQNGVRDIRVRRRRLQKFIMAMNQQTVTLVITADRAKAREA